MEFPRCKFTIQLYDMGCDEIYSYALCAMCDTIPLTEISPPQQPTRDLLSITTFDYGEALQIRMV